MMFSDYDQDSATEVSMSNKFDVPARASATARKASDLYHTARSIVFGIKFGFLWLLTSHDRLGRLNRYEGKVYSQNGEDGILTAIFRRVGTTNKFCVEFGVGGGIECDTGYLVRKKGWSSLWMDDSPGPSNLVKSEFITAENINQLFIKYHVPETFDLLCMDLDLNTYWIWKAIARFSPRVVVVEYNSSFPPDKSVTVRYEPHAMWDGSNYMGASLLALTRLGAEKGYSLVACESKGINAFFIRNDLMPYFMPRSIEKLYKPPGYGQVVGGRHTGEPPTDKLFVEV